MAVEVCMSRRVGLQKGVRIGLQKGDVKSVRIGL